MKRTFRKSWLTVHRWLGLTVGLLFVLLGLTGSLLVFDHAIDEWLNPELLLAEQTGNRRPIAEVVTAAKQAYRRSTQQPLSVSRPRVENGVWSVWFSAGTADNPKFAVVYVNPYTAEVTGQRIWGEDFMSWVYRLHFRLLAGETGATIIGSVGIILMISIVSGAYLWWPLWKNGWRAAFAIRQGIRFNYDLHKTTGIVSAVFLLVTSFTGVYMEFKGWFHSTIETFAEITEPPKNLVFAAQEGAQPLTPDEAVAIAQKEFPGARFDHLHPPIGSDGFFEVAFRQQGEVQKSFGRSQVFLDQYTGKVLAIGRPQDFTAADAFIAWQFPLHNGEAFGFVGRWTVFMVGLTPGLLYVTGFVLWLRGRRSRKWIARDVTSQNVNEPKRRVSAALEVCSIANCQTSETEIQEFQETGINE